MRRAPYQSVVRRSSQTEHGPCSPSSLMPLCTVSSEERVVRLRTAATRQVREQGIALVERDLPRNRPAEFDGLSITLATGQPLDWQCWYLVHSHASIAGWTLNLDGVARMYDELRDAKEPSRAAARLESFVRQ